MGLSLFLWEEWVHHKLSLCKVRRACLLNSVTSFFPQNILCEQKYNVGEVAVSSHLIQNPKLYSQLCSGWNILCQGYSFLTPISPTVSLSPVSFSQSHFPPNQGRMSLSPHSPRPYTKPGHVSPPHQYWEAICWEGSESRCFQFCGAWSPLCKCGEKRARRNWK